MLKMYHRNPHSGDTPDYWANAWDDVDFEKALKLCDTDPLTPLFEKYISPESVVLEGGCGKGHWVAWLANRGIDVIGLDFSERTLKDLGRNRGGLKLTAGNVNALPFPDDAFDIYYSGGVVEHFESGCYEALAEARRVTKPNGTLLVSVPYFSPMRRILKPFRSDSWRVLSNPEPDAERVFEGLTYFQYAYTVPEFRRIAKSAGLETIETMGYSVMWGLYDLRVLSERAHRKNQLRKSSPQANSPDAVPSGTPGPKNLIKDLLIGEGSDTPVRRAVTRVARWTAANMMMFVLRKNS